MGYVTQALVTTADSSDEALRLVNSECAREGFWGYGYTPSTISPDDGMRSVNRPICFTDNRSYFIKVLKNRLRRRELQSDQLLRLASTMTHNDMVNERMANRARVFTLLGKFYADEWSQLDGVRYFRQPFDRHNFSLNSELSKYCGEVIQQSADWFGMYGRSTAKYMENLVYTLGNMEKKVWLVPMRIYYSSDIDMSVLNYPDTRRNVNMETAEVLRNDDPWSLPHSNVYDHASIREQLDMLNRARQDDNNRIITEEVARAYQRMFIGTEEEL